MDAVRGCDAVVTGSWGTVLIRMPFTAFSVKTRTEDPVDDAEDIGLPHWAGATL